MKSLRFAPLIRVSTERQKTKGESLSTQKKQIEQAVESLNGVIPEDCWQYSGQEHATAQQERKKMDALLRDSSEDVFDAIVVADISRWSRDNKKNKEGLQVLKQSGIRFFVMTTEYDLFDPEHVFSISMFSELGELQASQQVKKSLENKIERLKRNIPASGKLPYGRTYDKAAGKWGVDEEKKKLIEKAALMYLSGDSFEAVAKKTRLSTSYLFQILCNKSGDHYDVVINSDKLNIHETLPLKIPRLLSDDVIEAIKKRSAANRTFYYGKPKHQYLLQRMVFCGHCGLRMFGQTQKGRHQYYRHEGNKNGCPFNYIRLDVLEAVIMEDVRELVGDRKAREEAMKEATVELGQARKLEEDKKLLKGRLNRLKREESNLVQAVADGALPNSVVKLRYGDIEQRRYSAEESIKSIDRRLSAMVTEEQIKDRAKAFAMKAQALDEQMHHSYLGSKAHFSKMSFDEKKTLLQLLFKGKDADGKPLGVYLYKRKDKWIYRIRGTFPEIVGAIREEALDSISDFSKANTLKTTNSPTDFIFSIKE